MENFAKKIITAYGANDNILLLDVVIDTFGQTKCKNNFFGYLNIINKYMPDSDPDVILFKSAIGNNKFQVINDLYGFGGEKYYKYRDFKCKSKGETAYYVSCYITYEVDNGVGVANEFISFTIFKNDKLEVSAFRAFEYRISCINFRMLNFAYSSISRCAQDDILKQFCKEIFEFNYMNSMHHSDHGAFDTSIIWSHRPN